MDRITIIINEECISEKEYVLRWIFEDTYAISIEINVVDGHQGVTLSRDGVEVTFGHSLFSELENYWLRGITKLRLLDIEYGGLSSYVFGKKECRNYENDLACYDIFGTIFYTLTCYEERFMSNLDIHGRVRASDSFLSKHGLLDRPIVNELIEILWAVLEIHFQGIKRKLRKFRFFPSHDIDLPSEYGKGWRSRTAARFLIKEQNIAKSLRAFAYPYLGAKNDRYDGAIDWLMDTSESAGVLSSFFYIPYSTHRLDPRLEIGSKQVVGQWSRISERGHLLGYHPGYASADSVGVFEKGSQMLMDQLREMGIRQEEVGGRQHCLRWSRENSVRMWNDAGFSYDSTMGYAEVLGFRCGTCYEFPMYCLDRRVQLQIKQRPLIVMDCTVVDERYMNLGDGEEAYDMIMKFKRVCEKYSGDFTLLWHNNRLVNDSEKDLYKSILNTK